MNKSHFFGFFFLVFNLSLMAQVGIGTSNPEKELHISGTNSTIRVDGLNQTNNANNSGTASTPLGVNSDGDLIVLKKTRLIVDNRTPFTTPVSVISTGSFTTSPIFTTTFTLTDDALIQVSSCLLFDILEADGDPLLSDLDGRSYGTAIHINGTRYARDTRIIFGSDVATITGTFSSNLSTYIILPAGTHTLEIIGIAFASTAGTSSEGVRVDFDNADGNFVQVINHN